MAIDEKKLIDADKLIEDLIPILQNLDNPYVVGRIIGCINIQPSLTFEIIQATKTSDKWIPCSERLPDKDGKYLVATDGTYGIDAIDIAMYENGKWLKSSKILAWMYLPDEYKGE